MESRQPDDLPVKPPQQPQWPYRRRLTCSVWVVGQWLLFGGKRKFIQSPHVWWLFRAMWSPDADAVWPDRGRWYSFVPRRPVRGPWYATLWDSLWFDGKVRLVAGERRVVCLGADLEPCRECGALPGEKCRSRDFDTWFEGA